MAGHFFRPSTSPIGTTTPPNTEIEAVNGANCKIIDIFWRFEDAGTRQTKLDQLHFDFYNYARERLGICNFGLLDN